MLCPTRTAGCLALLAALGACSSSPDEGLNDTVGTDEAGGFERRLERRLNERRHCSRLHGDSGNNGDSRRNGHDREKAALAEAVESSSGGSGKAEEAAESKPRAALQGAALPWEAEREPASW